MTKALLVDSRYLLGKLRACGMFIPEQTLYHRAQRRSLTKRIAPNLVIDNRIASVEAHNGHDEVQSPWRDFQIIDLPSIAVPEEHFGIGQSAPVLVKYCAYAANLHAVECF